MLATKYRNDFRKDVEGLKENTAMLKETTESLIENADIVGLDDEAKKGLEGVTESLDDIDKQSDSIMTDEDKTEVIKKNKLSYFIDQLNKYAETQPDARELCNKRIQNIKDSYLLTPLFSYHASYDRRNLKEEVKKMQTIVIKKLDDNSKYMFPSPYITNKISDILPEEYKNKAKKITAHIYSYILACKIDNESIFIYFLLKNFSDYIKYPNNFDEANEFSDSLIKLAKIV